MSTNQSKMYEANEAATGRLTIRDLVIAGIFGELLLAAAAVGGVGFAITPTLTFYFPLGASLLPGPIFLLCLSKVPKRGGLTLIGIVVALLNLVTGMHWGNAIGAVVCAILAELIAGIHLLHESRDMVLTSNPPDIFPVIPESILSPELLFYIDASSHIFHPIHIPDPTLKISLRRYQ